MKEFYIIHSNNIELLAIIGIELLDNYYNYRMFCDYNDRRLWNPLESISATISQTITITTRRVTYETNS